MILILSDYNDVSTNEVIDWLLKLNKRFLRINPTDRFEINEISMKSNGLKILVTVNDTIKFDMTTIDSFWCRRGKFNPNYSKDEFELFKEIPSLNTYYSFFLEQEYESIYDFIYSYLNEYKQNINFFYDDARINKLSVMLKAKSIGLRVPDFDIITNRKENQFFKGKINKAIKHGFAYNGKDVKMLGFTKKTDRLKLNEDTSVFFPSLVQQGIEKIFEVRTFYLKKKMYSMAIFSQSNEQTQVDFRQYDINKPNRNVPYELPESIEEKLILLMETLNMNSGSIDILVDASCNYYFLEVNPIGQFKQVSVPCNYQIEKVIANIL